jgi:prepilin-type N-terminal cleavage/methylation domain-containing protein
MTRQAGLTLIEALVVLAIIGLAVGAVALKLQPLETPLDTATSLIEGFFRQARLNAIASTSAYRVTPSLAGRLQASRASSCTSTTWTTDNGMKLSLPDDVTVTPVTWTVCYSSRGICDANVVVTVSHPAYGSKRIEVLLGGTTRVLQ